MNFKEFAPAQYQATSELTGYQYNISVSSRGLFCVSLKRKMHESRPVGDYQTLEDAKLAAKAIDVLFAEEV